MLNKLSIKRKLLYSFLIILGLVFILFSYSIYSIEQTSKGFKNYREMAKDTVLASRVQANMLMLEVNVEKFLKNPKTQEIQNFEYYYKRTMQFVNRALKDIQKHPRNKMVKTMNEELQKYRTLFYQVVNLYEERNKIVNANLDVNGKKIEILLTSVMKSANKDGDTKASLEAAKTIRTLLLARLYTMKYLISNEMQHAQRVEQEFTLLQNNIKSLRQEVQNRDRKEQLTQTVLLIDRYKKGVQDIVKTIKIRNEIINKKLNVIGIHITTLAENVKLSIKKDQDSIGPEVSKIFTVLESVLLIISSIIFVFIILIMIVIPKNIMTQLCALNDSIKNLIDSKDIYTKLIINSNDEIAQVSKNFNRYLEQKDNIIKSREELLRNISHELKTPISKGNFLVDKLRIKNDKTVLDDIGLTFIELEELITKLLEREKLKFVKLEKISFKITTLIMESISKLSLIDESLITVSVEEDFKIDGDMYYLTLAIKNIVDNALKYSTKYPIKIIIFQDKLQVLNFGEKLSHDISYYYQPFTRDSILTTGHGLGLGFAHKILLLHNFELDYQYKNQKNIFTITF